MWEHVEHGTGAPTLLDFAESAQTSGGSSE